MTLNLRAIILATVLGAVAITMATSAFAANNSGATKPGWGYGDKNHVHTGPPGQSVRP